MKTVTRIIVSISMLLAADAAFAWDCSYWSQSTDSSAECYKAPASAGSTNNQTVENQPTNNNTATGGKSSATIGNVISNSSSVSRGGSVGNISATGGSGGSGGQGGNGGSSNQTQSQGQSQTANGGAGGASDSTATNGGVNNVLTFKSPRLAPAAFAGGTNTTSDCYHSIGFGISTIFGGVSFGKGNKSKDCFRVALANEFYAREDDVAGDRIMCKVTEVVEALGDDCLDILTAADAAHRKSVTVQAPPEYVTQEQLRRAFVTSVRK